MIENLPIAERAAVEDVLDHILIRPGLYVSVYRGKGDETESTRDRDSILDACAKTDFTSFYFTSYDWNDEGDEVETFEGEIGFRHSKDSAIGGNYVATDLTLEILNECGAVYDA
jgi:hypothetical protein